jgi:chitosanase
MLTEFQKKTAQAIIEVFETGRIGKGGYGTVTLIKGDTGGLSYGKHQASLNSGNLALLVARYIEANGAEAENLRRFLKGLEARDGALNNNKALHAALAAAGNDPIMEKCQVQFFDELFWLPSCRAATQQGVSSALGHAVIFDGHIHGGFWRIAKSVGSLADEREWVKRYIATRRHWLANHNNPVLHKTVYRMDAFLSLVEAGNWDLEPPVKVRGVVITPEVLGSGRDIQGDSAEAARPLLQRVLRQGMEGEDVRAMQLALGLADADADGNFGPNTYDALILFQKKSKLKVDGVAGPATMAALGLGS